MYVWINETKEECLLFFFFLRLHIKITKGDKYPESVIASEHISNPMKKRHYKKNNEENLAALVFYSL